MALALVQKTARVRGSATTTVAITFATNPIVGNAVIVPVIIYEGNGFISTSTLSCADNKGNSYTLAKVETNQPAGSAIFYCPKVVTSGAAFTVTVTQTFSSYFETCGIEISGVGTGLVVDRLVSAKATNAAPGTGTTAALTTADPVVVASLAISFNQTAITVASVVPAWVEAFENLSNSATIAGEADFRFLTGVLGTAQSCSWVATNSGINAAVLVAFGAGVPAAVTVPSVVGLTEAAATTALTAAGLTKGTVTSAPHATVAAGLVISQVPAAGGTAAPGSAVNLTVSSGPPDWDLTVAGVSQKARALVTGGLSIRLESSERSTLRCTLRRTGGYMPARFDPVLAYDKSGALMYGGIILSREVDAEVPALETVTISCVDWWVYLDWALVTLTYTAPVTTKTILTALVAALPASYGFTVAASQVNGLTYESYSSGDNVKASEVLRGLARDLGYRPDVSPAKVLAVIAPGTTAAPFSITTAAPHCQAARWLDPTGTPANRIVLRCGPAGVGEFIAYNWVGDGTKRVFALKGVAVPSSSVWPGVCFVGGVQLPVWLPGEGPPDHIEWDYALNDGTLTFIGGGTSSPPGVGVDIELRYAPQFPFTVIASSGATPEISEIFSDETIIVYEQGTTRAAALLAERNQPAARELAVSSQADGWRPDQVVAVNLSQLAFVGNCTIGAVDIRLQLDELWLYQFTAVETTIVPGSALDIWRKLIGGSGGSGAAGTAIGSGGGGGGLTQLTGEVTAGPGNGSVVATIANDAVTYAKMQNVSAISKLLGRGAAAGAGDVQELALGIGLSMTGTTVNLGATVGTWTPVDASGAGLVLTIGSARYWKLDKFVAITGHVTYPTTANTGSAAIAGLPVNNGPAYGGFYSTSAPLHSMYSLQPNTSTFYVVNGATGAIRTNAELSGVQLIFVGVYLTA